MSLIYRISRQAIASSSRWTKRSPLFRENYANIKSYTRTFSSTHSDYPGSSSDNCENKFEGGKPTLEYAKCLRVSYSSMTNGDLLHLSSEGDPKARREALVRNIMACEEIPYDDAWVILEKIINKNKKYIKLHDIPYKAGLAVSLSAGLASIPLVFHYESVLWCHDLFVSADIPEPQDRESVLEVGSWSWAWMEPILGQISFVLLTLQFARGQLINIGLKPYGGFMKAWRAKRMIELFPKYDETLMTNFVNSEYS